MGGSSPSYRSAPSMAEVVLAAEVAGGGAAADRQVAVTADADRDGRQSSVVRRQETSVG